MRRGLWLGAGLIAAAQALFGLATLVWPAGMDLGAVLGRLMLWQAAPVWLAQIFPGVPILLVLVRGARGGLVRALLLLSLVTTLALPASMMLQSAWAQGALEAVQAPHGFLRLLGLARWGDALIGLAALIALRLAARAEALEPGRAG